MSAEWSEPPVAPDNQGIPGKTLAAQREAMGWTVEQIADQLKMAVRQVVALEAGDYASLPGPAVVRGFVRAYAKVVKLDPVPLVAQIALDTPDAGEGAGSLRRNKPASFSEVRFPTNGKRAGLPLGAIALAVLVIAAGVGAWQLDLVPGGLLRSAPPADNGSAAGSQASVTVLPAPVGAQPANGQIETTLVKPGEEAKPQTGTSVPLISVPPPSAAPGAAAGTNTPAGVAGAGATTPAPVVHVPGAVVTPAAPAATAPAAAPAAPAGANPLVLSVTEDSWVEVRRAKGAPLLKRMLKAGTTETVDVAEPVTLIVGKPSGVSATLRGAAVELPPVPGGTISRVNLK
jgi:cytoskeleton protein RodZ